MPYRVNVVNWQQAKSQLKSVREKVFVCERRIPYEVEFDRNDRRAHHVLVVDEDSKEPVATGRITNQGELSRICVVISKRKSPIGKQVIDTLLDIARKNNLKEVYINSSLDAVDYFLKHNFRTQGSVFMEAGLPRQRMVCPLQKIDFKRFYLSH
ncbi:GNAT family N-acetyltransferase [Thalassomonas sp. M1454]|uniref:GNAT family N-acetyltransferase n=1 Tax=Thalassomonas sp. M1454 TaxID=2594477 RepID=UPI00117D180B|nr:GNAT family N-acetyltransferase [Thalassomonas sp. M1454]TRX56917.1 GNAT family N-acetyltransferase [Thalassomonas sp. M1454]